MTTKKPNCQSQQEIISINAASGGARIAAFREIVRNGQRAKIDGLMVDIFTAQAVIAVHDGLSEKARGTLCAMDVAKMARVCLGVLNRARA